MTRVPRQPTSAQFRQAHFEQIRDSRGKFSGGWGFAFVGLQSTGEALEQFSENLREGLHTAAQTLADQMLAYAQENAPWEDHPGVHEDARDNLQSHVVWNGPDEFTVFLGHGKDVHYGIWLEVRWGGRYAILVPTLEHFRGQVGGILQAGISQGLR